MMMLSTLTKKAAPNDAPKTDPQSTLLNLAAPDGAVKFAPIFADTAGAIPCRLPGP